MPEPLYSDESIYDALARVRGSWGLSVEQMAAVVQVPAQTYMRWMMERSPAEGSGTVPRGMECALPILAIHQRLNSRFSSIEEQVKWLFTTHADFGNRKPIDIIASSPENSAWVAYYLDSNQKA